VVITQIVILLIQKNTVIRKLYFFIFGRYIT